MRVIQLSDRKLWSWRQAPSPVASTVLPASSTLKPNEAASPSLNSFRPCAQFPSQIHAELLAAKLIPDPFLRRNEELVQWVGEADWIYQCEFELRQEEMPREGETAELVFEGLDTFATVYVNGTKVLEAENMHREYRTSASLLAPCSSSSSTTPVPATTPSLSSVLIPGRNTLYLVFHSAFRRGRELEEHHLGRGMHWPAWNGDKSRLFVRKAGYNYGWDWGPVLMTAGPYRPVRLEIFGSRIFNFYPRATVSEKLEASLSLSWQIASSPELAATLLVRTRILHPGGAVIKQAAVEVLQEKEHTWRFEKDEVELWWTNGSGEQPLYTVEVDLVDMTTGTVLHSVSRKVGFRRLRVLREPLANEPGSTFLFELNNIPLFIGGSNWIPVDSILTNANEERYRRWLELASDGKQNMVRVWGGGVYEPECFYDICDELGLLVWQDFMFACGSYPAHTDGFRENVEREVEGVVTRLRHHPSLAIFAGNNEDYQIAESEGLQYDSEDKQGDWLSTDFPARHLYEHTFPRIVASNSHTFYWPGSPWGGSKTTDPTEGDLHCWSVWHGSQNPYQNYGELGGRFVSEFGMEGAPSIRTLDYLLDGDLSERFPQSRTLSFHNKADGFERRLACYLIENIRFGSSLEDYVFATQLVQSEALAYAISSWRRKFTGGVEGAYCAGALVWQLNDVWPCTSWSIVDYFLRPKPAYFAIKRALSPLALSGRRYTTKSWPDRFSTVAVEKSYVDLWAASSHLGQQDVKVEVEAFDLLSGKRVHHECWSTTLQANRSSKLKKLEIPLGWNDGKTPVVVCARLQDGKGEVLSRVSLYPEPFKYLAFPPPSSVNLRVKLDRRSGTLIVSAERPVKGLVFSFSEDVKLSDNGLDLIPGEAQTVKVEGLKEETQVLWRYLGDEHSP